MIVYILNTIEINITIFYSTLLALILIMILYCNVLSILLPIFHNGILVSFLLLTITLLYSLTHLYLCFLPLSHINHLLNYSLALSTN